jgi:hypothetical protein
VEELALGIATKLSLIVFVCALTCAGCPGDPPEPDPRANCDALPSPDADDDGDGLSNFEECSGTTILVDTLGFGLVAGCPDCERRIVVSDPSLADSDGDALDDLAERNAGTDPNRADTDGDGLDDYQEVTRWQTNPTTVDSDCDSRAGSGAPGSNCESVGGPNPMRDLWDAAELRLVVDPNDPDRSVPGIGATDPMSNDTDGDGFSDLEELVDTVLRAAVADLPSIRLDLVGETQIFLDVTYSSGTIDQRMYGSAFDAVTTSELTRSDSTSTAVTAEQADMIGVEAEVGVPPSASVTASATRTSGVARTTATELTSSTANAFGESWSEERLIGSSNTISTDKGVVVFQMRFTNDGQITYQIADMAIAMKRYDTSSGRASVLANIEANLGANCPPGCPTLSPGQSTDRTFSRNDLPPDLVRDFLRDPSSLFFEASSPELLGREEFNFDFVDNTVRKTALIVIDKGSRAIGDESARTLRVATGVNRSDDGQRVGISLGDALKTAGVSFETMDRSDGTTVISTIEDISFEVHSGPPPDLGDPAGSPGPRVTRGFWLAISPEEGQLDPRDVTQTILRNGDEIRLVYVRDEDRDGVFDREEYLHGSRDTGNGSRDSDGDGLSDFFEIKVGWLPLFVVGDPRMSEVTAGPRVFSHPGLADFDGDGVTDPDELDRNLNPRSADTDDDGVSDDVDFRTSPEPCGSDADCAGKVCNLQTCVGANSLDLGERCNSNDACKSGSCADTFCTPGAIGAQCSDDADCASEACFEARCISPGSAGESCDSPQDCLSGPCESGRCATLCGNGICEDGELCGRGDDDDRECLADCGLCPDGTTCAGSDQTCFGQLDCIDADCAGGFCCATKCTSETVCQ